MPTIDRINKLLLACDMQGVRVHELHLKLGGPKGEYELYKSYTPCHDVIDRIDRATGIITRFTIKGDLAHVGNRLARLERHVKARECPPYFFLGALAENAGALHTG